jgi:tetratricopeptide (TPR) repeat protein
MSSRTSPNVRFGRRLLFTLALLPLLPPEARPQDLVPNPAARLHAADSLYDRGDSEPAFALLDAHLLGAPADYQARWKAARAAVSVGLLQPSEEEQNRWYRRGIVHGSAAVRLQPDGVEGLYWLAANQGRLAIQVAPRAQADGALEVYRLANRLLSIDSLHAGAHNALGKIAYEVMRLTWIERLLAKALVGNEALASASWEAAERHLRKAVELDPETPMFHLDLGRTYLYTDRFELAERELELALDLPYRHPGDALYKQEAAEALALIRELRRR